MKKSCEQFFHGFKFCVESKAYIIYVISVEEVEKMQECIGSVVGPLYVIRKKICVNFVLNSKYKNIIKFIDIFVIINV